MLPEALAFAFGLQATTHKDLRRTRRMSPLFEHLAAELSRHARGG